MAPVAQVLPLQQHGWGGIRTLGTLRYTRFPGVPNRPLWHPSLRAGDTPASKCQFQLVSTRGFATEIQRKCSRLIERLIDGLKFSFKFALPFLNDLQLQLVAMQLDGGVMNVPPDFGQLRLAFAENPLQLGLAPV